ncbi:MAG: transcriptional regulator NrdR [Chloroflexi bacterium]|nr:transcriptional regulator NrdR [Chloroflexota bacterium]
MRCPYCQFGDSKVIDSRELNEGGTIRRRRECLSCGMRYTTYERVESVSLTVVKKDNRREEYDRRKLFDGIRKACTKRPIGAEQLETVVNEIEGELFRLNVPEVPSSVIGELVMERLRGLDLVAYIRFASVYRSFADLESLRRELDSLTEAKP